jgi:undecaprenyl diphosphate synthase
MTTSAAFAPTPGAARHVAIIMDGNGRWASARGMPRAAGHRQGAESVRRVVETAPSLGIQTLTLYAFSSDNWRRPPREVAALMRLFRSYLRSETDRLIDNGVRLSVIGRRDRLPGVLRAAVDEAELRTAHGSRLHLRLAIDYSARDAIIRAAKLAGSNADISREEFGTLVARACTPENGVRALDVDLLVRTGGERRLSDFLLWECAYAELYFTDTMWPDFDGDELAEAVNFFSTRERKFGALAAAAS